jgi:uncharacterized membrane protein
MADGQDPLSAHVNENIESIATFTQREERKIGRSERQLAHLSGLIGRPAYLIGMLLLVGAWVLGNAIAAHFSLPAPDPPPFERLQLLLGIAALATTTIVLITQQRQAQIESQRAHLDLQVNLLTEQKVTTLIRLIEELRRDLPMVRDRDDPEANALQVRTDTSQVLSAIAELGVGRGDAPAPGGAHQIP